MKKDFKYNSFTSYDQFDAVFELSKIHFFQDGLEHLNFNEQVKKAFQQYFPQISSDQPLLEAQEEILVSEDLTLAKFLNGTFDHFPAEYFYCALSQILGFKLYIDFDIGHAGDFLKKIGQKILADQQVDNGNFKEFVFDSLNFRSANGLSLIDNLVNDGFLKRRSKYFDFKSPIFFAGRSLAFLNSSDLIFENYYVDTRLDTDHDGKNDLVLVTVSRPKYSSSSREVPVILTASPYYFGTNDMEDSVYDPSGDLVQKKDFDFKKPDFDKQALLRPPLKAEKKSKKALFSQGSQTVALNFPLNDYFASRGFAIAYYAGLGTRGSDGLRSTGGFDETLSACAVIEFLSGKKPAFTEHQAQGSIFAAWSNGSVAMTGRSYLGTLATACATENPQGLKTIISESAISSWYDYYRENGLVAAPGGFQGEDTDVLAVDTFSRWFDGKQYRDIHEAFEKSLKELGKKQDRKTGNYNRFWDERNYLNSADKVKIDCLYVHGLNDWNVKPVNVYNIYRILAKRDTALTKVILHQGQHISPHDIRSLDYLDICNFWLSAELYSLDNDLDSLPNIMVEDNLDPEIWHGQKTWGQVKDSKQIVLSDIFPGSDRFVDYQDDLASIYHNNYHDFGTYEKDFLSFKNIFQKSVLRFKIPSFDTKTIDGSSHLSLSIKTDRPVGMLSALLVELDAKKHSSTVTKPLLNLNFKFAPDRSQMNLRDFYSEKKASHLISDAHLNLQNIAGPGKVNQIKPGIYYQAELDFQPTFYRLKADSQIFLMIFGCDIPYTIHPKKIQNYTVDLDKSSLFLPLL